MYNVLNVCRYIINYSNTKGYSISNLKLQKLLYLIQAYFLIESDGRDRCFSDTIEAWDFGPVVPIAYHEYKQYGGSDIPYIDSYIDVDRNNLWSARLARYNDSCISDEDKNKIDMVIDEFSGFSASNLVEMTHNQRPWKKAYKKGKNEEITINSIAEYFCG